MKSSQNNKTNTHQDDQHGSSEAHTALIIDCLLALGRECADVGRFFRNETGMALNPRTEEPFTYGVKGSPDIYGLVIGGFYVGLECKTGNAKLNDNQQKFHRMCERFNVRIYVVRSAEEAVEIVKREVEKIKGMILLLEQAGRN